MNHSILKALAIVVLLSPAGAAMATPRMGDDCKACHNSNTFLPPAHPQVANMSSQVCKTCHLAAMEQDQTRINAQDREQEREQSRDQQRDQTQTRRQVRLGGDPAASPLGTHAGALRVDTGREIELYLERSEDGTDRNGGGHDDDDKQSHEHHHGETRMSEDNNTWAYRFVLGYLYSSDIEQHQSGSHFGGGGSDDGDHAGGDHGGGSGHDAGEGSDGSFFRIGGQAAYTSYIGNDQTLTYGVSLNRDVFTGLNQVRYVGRAKLDWKWKLDDGTLKLSPYLQRSVYDTSDGRDRAFWALGLNANRHISLSPTSTISFTFRYKQRHYDGETNARGADLRLGTVYQDSIGDWGSYRLGLGLSSRNNPKHDDKRYFGQVLTAGIGRPLDSNAFVWLSGEIGHRGYRGPDRSAGITRDDRFVGVGLSYVDPRLQIFETVPQLSCHVRWTDSNIGTYDTTSTYCSILFEKRF